MGKSVKLRWERMIECVSQDTKLEKAVVKGLLAQLELEGADARVLNELRDAIVNLELAAVEAAEAVLVP